MPFSQYLFIILGVLGLFASLLFVPLAISIKTKNFVIIAVICVICTIIGFVGLAITTPKTSTNKNSATCQVCHKTFSYEDNEYGGYDYDNVRKIKHTNMCERCYNNYKAAQYAKDYVD